MTDSKVGNNLIFHLEKAIENGEFEVYYQPIIHTISGSLCGFESLVRWNHPTYGFLNPGNFIDALEETKQIYHLDLHLVESVCRRYRNEVDAGRPVVPFSVNLSRVDFEEADVFSVIEELTRKYRMPRNMLNIEVTESAFANEERLMTEAIKRFREAGYQVWMDDFGSGYSSFNTLKDHEFDELKIDMRFLTDMSLRSKRIISSIVSMAKNIRMVTLAEGVETKDQVDFLRRIGCDRLQGYYFSKPLPYGEILKVLEEKNVRFETEEDRRYYHEINRINLLSPSPFNVKDTVKESHGGGIPLAILERCNGQFSFIYENEEFINMLEMIGAKNAPDAIQRLVHFGYLSKEEIMEFISGVIEKGDKKIDFSVNGDIVSARGKLISSSLYRSAVLLSINNITRSMDISHEQLIDQRLMNIYSMYLRVSVLRPEVNELVTVFSQIHNYVAPDIPHDYRKLILNYAEDFVAPEDRKKYLDFLDPETVEKRVSESERGFINTKIHTKDSDGQFTNKMFLAVSVGNHEVLLLVRYANL